MKTDPARRWLTIATMLSGSIATMLTATIVNVALPSITGAFGLGQDQAQWMATAFLTASTGSMLLNAWAIAGFGPRASFMAAMSVFLAGSLIGATSHAYEGLVLARVLQGAGAGLIQPLAMYVLFRLFPEGERGLAIGLYALGVIVSPAFGPVIGGWLVDLGGWRVVFFATSPIALAALFLAPVFLPGRETGYGEQGRTQDRTRRPSLDWPGLVLIMCAVALAMNGIATGHREGWSSTPAVSRLFLAVVSTVAFLGREATCTHPVLELRLFRNPAFITSVVVIASTGLAIYGSTYLFPLFVQLVQGYSPTGAGLVLLPAGLLMSLAFPLAGRFSDRVGPLPILAPGILIFGAAMFLLAGVTRDTPFWTLAAWIALSRFGIGFIMPSANAAVMREADPVRLASASSAATFFTQTGGAFGVNGLAVFLQERASFHLDAMSIGFPGGDAFASLVRSFRDAGASQAEASQRATSALQAILSGDAQMLAFRDCFWVLGCCFVAIGAVVCVQISLAHRARRGTGPGPKSSQIDQISPIVSSRS